MLAHFATSASLRISPCVNSSSQIWTIQSLHTPSTIISSNSGLCLATLSCAPIQGDGVSLRSCAKPICSDNSDILWTLDKNDLLTSVASNGQLTLTLANLIGPNVNLWAAKGAVSNGKWDFKGVAGGSGTLTTESTSQDCLSYTGHGTIAIINASAIGLPLYGIGGLAAIGGARLIYEYPPAQKKDILDLLFNATGGTAFQVLKTEIEGDMDSSYGSGSSFMHTRNEVPDFSRGIYLPWLLKEAFARNPKIGTYALAWGMPFWIQSDTPSGDVFLGADALAYRMQYFEGVRAAYNISFDLVGVHNERSWSRTFVKELRAALDSNGFNSTRISVGDDGNDGCEDCSGSDKTITTALATDSDFAHSLGVIGVHKAGDEGLPPLPNSYDWEINGKTYIQSESNTIDGTYVTLDGAFPQWDPNPGSNFGPGLSWPRQFILSYVNGRGTGTIICPLSHAWTWLYGRHNHGTAQFIRPWDGSYILGAAFWGQAHFTQATRAGWYFLDGSASGTWDMSDFESLAYATLVAPDLSAFSIIAVNVDANMTAPLAYRLVGTLATAFSSTKLSAWTSNATALFTQCDDVEINADGSFSFELLPRTTLTLTTLRTLTKFEPYVPSRAPFPIPYTSAFSSQAINEPGRFLSDLFGAFEISIDPLNVRGNVLRQAVPSPPHSWLDSTHGDGAPFTSLPAPGTAFANARFSVDMLVMTADALNTDTLVSACGRVPIWQPNFFHNTTGSLGVCLSLNPSTGTWILSETTLATGRNQIATGSLGASVLEEWHTVSLSFVDDTATAEIDGKLVAQVMEGTLHSATGGFGVGSGWHRAYFDHVSLDSVMGHAESPMSWLFDVLPGEILVSNFSGWAGFVLDLRKPTTNPLHIAGIGRFRARGNVNSHRLDILNAATGTSVLTAAVVIDLETCASDALGFCYATLSSPVALAAGERFYVVSYETEGGDAFVAMTDAAAATTHVHRDGSTLMSYAGPGQGIVAGKVSRADGEQVWTEFGDIECMFGPLNLILAAV